MKTFASILLAATVIFAACQPGADAASPAIGSEAPDFTLQGADGKTYSLDQFKGKYVVLEWLNHGCPFVKKHYESGNMQALQQTETAAGVVWLSIVSSAPGKQGYEEAADAQATAKKLGSGATAILLDPTGKVGKLYGAKVTPDMFIINPEGKLIYHGAIDSIRSTDAEDIPVAKNYVTTALTEARAGQDVSQSVTQPYGCGVKYAK